MSITCYDSDGNVLKTLYQWDNNQTMTVQGLDMSPIPVFHFCNRMSNIALVVTPTVSDSAVSVKIPNILLQQAEPIIAYVYQDTQNEGYRTMHAIHIPVIPRPKPDDYEYDENIDYTSVAVLNSRLNMLVQQLTGNSTTTPTPEVIDIRVGYDGTVYGSAGDAVRSIGYALTDLEEKFSNFENSEFVTDTISDAVAAEMDEYISSGKLAHMVIADGSISREKFDSNLKTTFDKADTAVQSINGKMPTHTGEVTIQSADIDAALQSVPYQGTLDGALELLAQEAMRTYQDKSTAFSNWLQTHPKGLPLGYTHTLPDGDYRISTEDCEYLYHKFTASEKVWITETIYSDNGIYGITVCCNNACVLSVDSEDGIIVNGSCVATAEYVDTTTKKLVDEKTRKDVTADYEKWCAEQEQEGASQFEPIDYVRTCQDGDYRIVSASSEYIYHKFTADATGWLTECTYEEDAILYFSIYCNDIPMLQYDSSGSVIFDAAMTVSGLALPKADSDAANKAYVDKTIENATGEIWDYLSLDLEDAPNFWERVQYLVRAGKAAALFPVGYEFTTTDADTGAKIAWVVRGHDHHKPADNALRHSMTLETKYVYSDANGAYKGLQFDAQEALYYAENGLTPGTYHFTVANQNWYADDNGKTFQFTLTQQVPEGGQVYLSMTYNATLAGKSVRTYADASSTAVIETATLTEGAEGTSLGTTNGVGTINHMHRIVFGSNNYAQSAARQWLNSDASVGSVWTPQTKYDRPPGWATAYNGLLHGLPAEFLEVVAPAVIPCKTNSIYECASLDGTDFTINQEYNLSDKFFLLSRPEIYGLSDSEDYKDGALLAYYDGLSNPERKKYDNGGTGRRAWLRSPYPAHATTERIVDLDGSGNITTANSSLGVAPACIIA